MGILASLQGTPLQSRISPATPTMNTPQGDVQIGSIISYQIRQCKKSFLYRIHLQIQYTVYVELPSLSLTNTSWKIVRWQQTETISLTFSKRDVGIQCDKILFVLT